MNQVGITNQGMSRLTYKDVSPEAFTAMIALETHVRRSGLERRLVNLVYLRVSQMNGCAFCIDMHSQDLRSAGETPERLALLVAWREAPHFTVRERAAFAFAEAVTSLGPGGVGDAVYDEARKELGDKALVELTVAIAMINVWNRLGITFQSIPGSYEPVVHS